MKTLMLLRHAKSSWQDAGLDDHDRPLNGRGREAAERMGGYLEQERLLPDRILCSSAARTVETLERLERSWKERVERRIEERLYLASAEQIAALARELDPALERVLFLGHNPGIHELAMELTGEGGADELAKMRRKYPTGALAQIAFPVDSWTGLSAGGGRLLRFVRPKDL